MNLSLAGRPALVPVVAALLLSACSEHSGGPTEPINEGDAAVVTIRDFAFSAPTITIFFKRYLRVHRADTTSSARGRSGPVVCLRSRSRLIVRRVCTVDLAAGPFQYWLYARRDQFQGLITIDPAILIVFRTPEFFDHWQ